MAQCLALLRYRCRFLRAGAAPPPVVKTSPDEDPFNFIYNATCMKSVRESLLQLINQNKTGLVRPAAIGSPAQPSFTSQYDQSLVKSYLFFKAQWTGLQPQGYEADVAWRTAGFVELDKETCKGQSYSASFANGSAAPGQRLCWIVVRDSLNQPDLLQLCSSEKAKGSSPGFIS
jgi:hypothetical protein